MSGTPIDSRFSHLVIGATKQDGRVVGGAASSEVWSGA
jgi:hypothetical protein